MNLHGIVRPLIRAVNPDIPVQWLQNTGYATLPSGARTPLFADPVTFYAQVQPVAGDDLDRLNNLNIQGVVRKVFQYGQSSGNIRRDAKGGDMFSFAQAGVSGGAIANWALTDISESWPDWSSYVVVLQAT